MQAEGERAAGRCLRSMAGAPFLGCPASGGSGPGCLPTLPADLTGLPGAPICGQGSLSWLRVLIKPGFLLRPPAGFLPQPVHPTSRLRVRVSAFAWPDPPKHQCSAGLPAPTWGAPRALATPCLPPSLSSSCAQTHTHHSRAMWPGVHQLTPLSLLGERPPMHT